MKVPAIRYTVQPTTTATSCLSSRRLTTNNDTKVTATATPTQSPTALPTPLTSERSPTTGRQGRKHVQFPDIPSITQAEKLGEFDICSLNLALSKTLIINIYFANKSF